MRKLLSFKVLTTVLVVFMIAGAGFAQGGPGYTTVLSGKVTAGDDSAAVAGHKFLLTIQEPTGFPILDMIFVTTDEDGNFARFEGNATITVAKNSVYTITSLDTLFYQPFTAEIAIPDSIVEFNVHLVKRTDLVDVTGNVSFKTAGVETEIYFGKLPDDTDFDDFRTFEGHFNIPGMLVKKWASYNTASDANGDFYLEMLDGKYVVYIPAADEYLTHWSVFEVDGNTTLKIILQELQTLSGNVANADLYDYVNIFAFSTNAGRPYVADTLDTNGNYSINLAPGAYKVRCNAYFYDETLDEDFMYSVFYDSVYKAADADTVVVGDGGAPDINFNLPVAEVSPFSVSGTIKSNQSGLALEGAQVRLMSYNACSNLFRAYEGETDASGNYTVNGYTMLAEDSLIGFAWKDSTFFAQFYDGKATFLTADPIVYHADEDVTGIDFALDTLDSENAWAISGDVVDEEGNKVMTGNITAFTTATSVGVVTAMIDTNGHYDFGKVFPNNSTVYLQAWGGYGYVPEMYNDAESWEDADAITIAGADQVIDFELAITGPARERLGLLKGYVNLGLGKAAEGSAYEGAVVYVKPAGSTSQWTDVDYVDQNGQFALPIEQEGSYDVMLSTRDKGDVEMTVNSSDGDFVMSPTGIGDTDTRTVLKTAKLHNAYPNPFNPMTTIEVDMAKTGQASLVIYNVIGQKVITLFNGNMQQGLRTFNWNGTAQNGTQVASGLYFYQLKTGATVQTKAVMFLK